MSFQYSKLPSCPRSSDPLQCLYRESLWQSVGRPETLMPQSFEPASSPPLWLDPSLPLPENFLRVALSGPGRAPVIIVHGQSRHQENEAQISEVKWSRLLMDVYYRKEELLRTTGLPARKLDEGSLVVGLLAQNGYDYFVTMVAMIMLRWTVSI